MTAPAGRMGPKWAQAFLADLPEGGPAEGTQPLARQPSGLTIAVTKGGGPVGRQISVTDDPVGAHPHLARAVSLFDFDGDGVVSEDELARAAQIYRDSQHAVRP